MNIIDITVPVQTGMTNWPNVIEPELTMISKISNGSSCNCSYLSTLVHSGTHIDAPLHCIDNKSSIDQLDLNTLIGEVWVADIGDVPMITKQVLIDSKLPSNVERILFKTNNSSLWSNPKHEFNKSFVALTKDASSYIVELGIKLVGIDYLSIQSYYDSSGIPHEILLGANVVILECINLHGIKQGWYKLICLPLRLVNSDGAPARAILSW